MNDEKIMQILQSGDKDAFFPIMEAYNKLLWVIVGSVLNNVGTVEDIEECISDVYVKIWKNPEAYTPRRGSFKSFISVVARRTALDRYRQLAKRKDLSLDDDIGSNDDELLGYVIKQEMYNELYEAVRSLKEPDKEILTRRYYMDEKPGRIAEKMSLPVAEIKNRLYQSKKKLKELLEEGRFDL